MRRRYVAYAGDGCISCIACGLAPGEPLTEEQADALLTAEELADSPDNRRQGVVCLCCSAVLLAPCCAFHEAEGDADLPCSAALPDDTSGPDVPAAPFETEEQAPWALAEAGIPPMRWSEYNRQMNDLLRGTGARASEERAGGAEPAPPPDKPASSRGTTRGRQGGPR